MAVPLFILHNRTIQPLQKVLYAILCVYKRIGKDDSCSTLIKHPAAYMVAIIIGTIDDIDLHFKNLVQYDFYNT